MTRYLTVPQLIYLHERIIRMYGGADGVRDFGALVATAAQPQMTFARRDLYTTLPAKAAALGHSLIANHPFIDGNKRVGHAAMEIFLALNGRQLQSPVDDSERVIVGVAAGTISREQLSNWVSDHMLPTS